MSFGFAIEVWGDRALFTRPELSVERFTYDFITPSAARGLVEAIYWHPGLRVVIDRIQVINPIEFTTVRRNEVKSKALASSLRSSLEGGAAMPYINTKEDIQQRAAVILTNVRYAIAFHFEMTEKANASDNPGKFTDIFRRRIEKGQCYAQPYFGAREFPAYFKACPEGIAPRGAYAGSGERDFGLMLFDMDYSNERDIVPMFYRAIMKNGIVEVSESEVYR